jgi:NADH dehydrogenase FAD-containing subunit
LINLKEVNVTFAAAPQNADKHRQRTSCNFRFWVSLPYLEKARSSDLHRWAGFNLSRQLDTKKFQPVVVSPRSYFVFTPLLASTAVGTLEFRTTLESVRKRSSGVEFFQGWADDVNFSKKRLTVEEAAIQRTEGLALTSDDSAGKGGNVTKRGKIFEMGYDKLVVAVGCYNQTFNTPGVKENALFLKDVGDARKIRKRILDCRLACFKDLSILANSPKASKRQLSLLHPRP